MDNPDDNNRGTREGQSGKGSTPWDLAAQGHPATLAIHPMDIPCAYINHVHVQVVNDYYHHYPPREWIVSAINTLQGDSEATTFWFTGRSPRHSGACTTTRNHHAAVDRHPGSTHGPTEGPHRRDVRTSNSRTNCTLRRRAKCYCYSNHGNHDRGA
jgi:hypothetical protein